MSIKLEDGTEIERDPTGPRPYVWEGVKESTTKILEGWTRGKERCLLEEAMKRQEKLPPHMKTNTLMISCPCSKCNPHFLG
jgi:hypothetical protein